MPTSHAIQGTSGLSGSDDDEEDVVLPRSRRSMHPPRPTRVDIDDTNDEHLRLALEASMNEPQHRPSDLASDSDDEDYQKLLKASKAEYKKQKNNQRRRDIEEVERESQEMARISRESEEADARRQEKQRKEEEEELAELEKVRALSLEDHEAGRVQAREEVERLEAQFGEGQRVRQTRSRAESSSAASTARQRPYTPVISTSHTLGRAASAVNPPTRRLSMLSSPPTVHSPEEFDGAAMSQNLSPSARQAREPIRRLSERSENRPQRPQRPQHTPLSPLRGELDFPSPATARPESRRTSSVRLRERPPDSNPSTRDRTSPLRSSSNTSAPRPIHSPSPTPTPAPQQLPHPRHQAAPTSDLRINDDHLSTALQSSRNAHMLRILATAPEDSPEYIHALASFGPDGGEAAPAADPTDGLDDPPPGYAEIGGDRVMDHWRYTTTNERGNEPGRRRRITEEVWGMMRVAREAVEKKAAAAAAVELEGEAEVEEGGEGGGRN